MGRNGPSAETVRALGGTDWDLESSFAALEFPWRLVDNLVEVQVVERVGDHSPILNGVIDQEFACAANRKLFDLMRKTLAQSIHPGVECWVIFTNPSDYLGGSRLVSGKRLVR